MLRIYHPPSFSPEREYILDVMMRQFLGLEYKAIVEECSEVRICFNGEESEGNLRIADDFFQSTEDAWMTSASLPKRPLGHYDTSELGVALSHSVIPVIYGRKSDGGGYVSLSERSVYLGIDIFGSAFFMLTRYEEAVLPNRDSKERFPASASLAFQEGFLDRPIVNEYLEILWWALSRLWPSLKRKKREYKLVLSHDVDWPLGVYNRTPIQVLKSAVGDILRRKDVALAFRRIRSRILVGLGDLDADLNNTFNIIMNISEQYGVKSSFYFIVDHSDGIIDGNYSLEHPWMQNLMRQIYKRGHEIGIHPSYYTFRDKEKIRWQVEMLLHFMESEGMNQSELGGRQHYLRWETPTTWQAWEEAGLTYDSTLSYADHAGFRCGTCYEYSVFNLMTRQSLNLLERPLVAMEASLLSREYMGFTIERSLEELRKLQKQCKRFKGEFTLLWHNSSLLKRRELNLYKTIVKEAAEK